MISYVILRRKYFGNITMKVIHPIFNDISKKIKVVLQEMVYTLSKMQKLHFECLQVLTDVICTNPLIYNW